MGLRCLVFCGLTVRKAPRHSAIVVVSSSRLYRASKNAKPCRSEPLFMHANGPITFCYGLTYTDRVSLAIGVARLSQTHKTNVGEAESRHAGK